MKYVVIKANDKREQEFGIGGNSPRAMELIRFGVADETLTYERERLHHPTSYFALSFMSPTFDSRDKSSYMMSKKEAEDTLKKLESILKPHDFFCIRMFPVNQIPQTVKDFAERTGVPISFIQKNTPMTADDVELLQHLADAK